MPHFEQLLPVVKWKSQELKKVVTEVGKELDWRYNAGAMVATV